MEEEKRNENTKYKLPSDSYSEARRSIVFTLSELMFGSLLASYILGFIGFAALQLPTPVPTLDGSALLSLPGKNLPVVFVYLAISLTFSYISAAVYISYHTTILSMPHYAYADLRWDFVVALLHAVLFGLSMLMPLAFPVFLSAVVLSAELRRRREFSKYIEWLAARIGDRGDQERVDKFAKRFREATVDRHPYSDWMPRRQMLWASAFLGGIGIVFILIAILFNDRTLKVDPPWVWIVLAVDIVIFGIVFFKTTNTLMVGAKFLVDEAEKKNADKTYIEIMERMEKESHSL